MGVAGLGCMARGEVGVVTGIGVKESVDGLRRLGSSRANATGGFLIDPSSDFSSTGEEPLVSREPWSSSSNERPIQFAERRRVEGREKDAFRARRRKAVERQIHVRTITITAATLPTTMLAIGLV